MEKPRHEPFYRAGHEEKIGIVMACSPMINMTKDRDSNDMFAREFVSRRNIEPCVKMPFDGDSNDMFAPCLRGGVVTANASYILKHIR